MIHQPATIGPDGKLRWFVSQVLDAEIEEFRKKLITLLAETKADSAVFTAAMADVMAAAIAHLDHRDGTRTILERLHEVNARMETYYETIRIRLAAGKVPPKLLTREGDTP